MKTMIVFLLALMMVNVVINGVASRVQAQTTDESRVEMIGMQAAIDARNDFIQNMEQKNFTKVTHDSLEHAIQELIEYLVQHDGSAMAEELQTQWKTSETIFFTANLIGRFDDLGDHAPLFAWLEDFFNKMSDKYGTIILSLPVVQNIRTLNFAIPVVFSPKGSWQVVNADNRIEYRKHFIPFANIVTYYATLYGCDYAVKKNGMDQLKQLCSKAADKLEFLMGRYVAPVVSDWIFKAGNSDVKIGSSRLRVLTADDLRSAIQQGT